MNYNHDEHEACRAHIREAYRHHENCGRVERVYVVLADGTRVLKPLKWIGMGQHGLVIEIGE